MINTRQYKSRFYYFKGIAATALLCGILCTGGQVSAAPQLPPPESVSNEQVTPPPVEMLQPTPSAPPADQSANQSDEQSPASAQAAAAYPASDAPAIQNAAGDQAAPDAPLATDEAGIPEFQPPVPVVPSSKTAEGALSPQDLMDANALPQPMNDLSLPNVVPPISENMLMDQQVAAEKQAELEREEKIKMREKAYEAAEEGIFPMDSSQIRRVIHKSDETNRAAETPLYPYPKPEVSFTTVSLDPGQPPVTIKLAVGHVTTLSILDITGQPWPVVDLTWAGNFEIVEPDESADDTGHILRITPLSDFAYGNLSMRLVGLNTPITFTLRTGREEVQYRLDIRVPEYGPAATTPIIDQSGLPTIAAGDKTLTAVLDGVPPTAAQKLMVNGVDGRTSAYTVDGVVYLRTPLTLLSPAWQASLRSADGMNVYAVPAAPVMLLSDRGRMVRATVQDQPQNNDQVGLP